VPTRSALDWMEKQPPPSIIAPRAVRGSSFRAAVPNNDLNTVYAAWSKGREPRKQPSELKTMKTIRSLRLSLDEGEPGVVTYLWRLSGPHDESLLGVLRRAARSVTHLGWGVDMVAADAAILSLADVDILSGVRWRPVEDASAMQLRVPVPGTLNALIKKHQEFLNRLDPEGFNPVNPLTTYGLVGYRSAADPAPRPFAAFSLRNIDGSFRPFDTPRHAVTVAAMMRHAASTTRVVQALGWAEEKVVRFILGHGEAIGQSHVPVDGPRMAFIPIPTIESRGRGHAEVVGSIRRAIVVGLGEQTQDDLQRVARQLWGAELVGLGQDQATVLSRIPDHDKMIQRYTAASSTWATVTPVVLPGYDDPRKLRKRLFAQSESGGQGLGAQTQKDLLGKLDRRIDFLLHKAIRQAGYTEELARDAAIEWRGTGFWPGAELATTYRYPEKLRRFRRLHVRITWRDATGNPIALPGPLCLGGGRFHGLGLFAAC
jgi:CRISPR-associated protein Csb2